MNKPTRKSGANTDGRDAKGRFARGNKGKAKGTRHKTTRAIEALLEGQAEALTQVAVERALAGDMAALRLCLERISPPRKESTVDAPLPMLTSAADVPQFLAGLVEHVSAGKLTPGEAEKLAKLADAYTKAFEVAEYEERLRALEEQAKTEKC